MDRREVDRFLKALGEVRAAGRPAAVATVVRVRGSAYRREGTRMLVRQDGTYECALSGGCLEPAVADRARHVIATGEPAIVNYDLGDDSPWGLTIGCSGEVDIRIERVEPDEVTSAWLDVLARGEAAVLVTPLAGVAGRRLLRTTGPAIGHLADPSLEASADAVARERLAARHPQSGPDFIGAAEIFYDVLVPPPELVIFGAGHDAEPVARHGWLLGFAVTVVDARDAYLQPDRFAGARLVSTPFDRLSDGAPLPAGAFVVVMNHHLERDRLALGHALESDALYVGVLGPRARFKRLMAALAIDGCSPSGDALARVHSPAGLSLGAETPEEVAVSILSEIVAVRRGFSGGFLNGRDQSLHRAPAQRTVARS